MEIVVLDPKGTHKSDGDPNCPVRLAHHPSGHWICVDCGLAIYNAQIEICDHKIYTVYDRTCGWPKEES